MLRVSNEYYKYVMENYKEKFIRTELEREIRDLNLELNRYLKSEDSEIDFLFNLEYLIRTRSKYLVPYLLKVFKKKEDINKFVERFNMLEGLKIFYLIRPVDHDNELDDIVERAREYVNGDRKIKEDINGTIYLTEKNKTIPINDFEEYYFEEADSLFKTLGDKFIIEDFKLTKNLEDEKTMPSYYFSSERCSYFNREFLDVNSKSEIVVNEINVKYLNYKKIKSPLPKLNLDRFNTRNGNLVLCIETNKNTDFILTNDRSYTIIKNIRKQYLNYIYENNEEGFMEIYKLADNDINLILANYNVFKEGLENKQSNGIIRFNNSGGFSLRTNLKDISIKEINKVCSKNNISIEEIRVNNNYISLVELITLLNYTEENELEIFVEGERVEKYNKYILKYKETFFRPEVLIYYLKINITKFENNFQVYYKGKIINNIKCEEICNLIRKHNLKNKF